MRPGKTCPCQTCIAERRLEDQAYAVNAALAVPCRLCNAKPGQPCTHVIRVGEPLDGSQIVHSARIGSQR